MLRLILRMGIVGAHVQRVISKLWRPMGAKSFFFFHLFEWLGVDIVTVN